MKFCSLASGSSGNCLVASAGHTTVLIDAGLSGIRVQRALADADIDPAKLSAILVTHEHRDHIHGVGVLARRFKLPVYANAGTWQAMAPDLGKLADHQKRVFVTGQAFDIGDMEIDSFATSHDAAEPVGFTLTDGQSAMGIATDTGTPTSAMMRALSGKALVVLESNHDVDMLQTGPYPYPLKRRIAGDLGHLSNKTAGSVAADLVAHGTTRLILAHLSHENNFPELAYNTAKGALREEGITVGRDTRLAVAPRSTRTELCNF
ncbi:MAG: MBL fold metallo-hydrolase [Eubacteriaceae bacterium]|nr:MBL fold metallo-hydrolase [Eubacteriaceae bacterium]MBR0384445.1 MBL fold metallo-hydrolase [Eubacteriaceae bacterium]